MTIVLTTHYLDEADSMAERVMVIDNGEVIADDTADRLKAQLAGDRILLTVDQGSMTRVVDARPPHRRPGGGRRRRRLAQPPRGRAEPRRCPGCCGSWTTRAWTVQAAEVRRPTLDDVFLTLTGRSLREEVAA